MMYTLKQSKEVHMEIGSGNDLAKWGDVFIRLEEFLILLQENESEAYFMWPYEAKKVHTTSFSKWIY